MFYKKHFRCLLTVICGGFLHFPITAETVLIDKHYNAAGELAGVDLTNGYFNTSILASGGRVAKLYDRVNARDLVFDPGSAVGGAFKDYFREFGDTGIHFSPKEYRVELLEESKDKAVVAVSASGDAGTWGFVTVRKVFTLNAGERRLNCELQIINPQESMTKLHFTYWSHNILGVGLEEQKNIFPLTNGTLYETPSSANNHVLHKNFRDGYLAVATPSSGGVVMTMDGTRLDLGYSWYCQDSWPMNTMEWRMIPQELPAGETFSSPITIGAFSTLAKLSGASANGVGSLEFTLAPDAPAAEITCTIEAFRPMNNAELKWYWRDSVGTRSAIDAQMIVNLTPATPWQQIVSIPLPPQSGTYGLIAELWENQELQLRMEEVAQVGKTTTSYALTSCEKVPPAADQSAAEMNPTGAVETPHFDWLAAPGNPAVDVLFILPAAGVRDAVECAQRMNITADIPTFKPYWYLPSWQSCAVIDVKAMLFERLDGKLAEKQYHAIVLGSDAVAPWEESPFRWENLTEKTREMILTQVENGSGLLYINPTGLSGTMETLHNQAALTPELTHLLSSVDFSAAPGMSKDQFKTVEYGKGKLYFIEYPTDAYLLPHPGYRKGKPHLQRRLSYQFQEYQFAVILKLLQSATGQKSSLRNITIQDDKLLVESTKPNVSVKLDCFDAFSNPLFADTVPLTAMPYDLTGKLTGGANKLHVRLLNAENAIEDFGFVVIDKPYALPGLLLSHKTLSKGETISAKPQTDLPESCEIEWRITDELNRLVYTAKGTAMNFNTANVIDRHHTITAVLKRNQQELERHQGSFDVTGVYDATKHYPVLMWTCQDYLPEYAFREHFRQLADFGVNFAYPAGTVDAETALDFALAPMDVTSNWMATFPVAHNPTGLENWQKTQDRQYLKRPFCPNNPQVAAEAIKDLDAKLDLLAPFASQNFFLLGDEMSISYYRAPWDVCQCEYCLKGFRAAMQKKFVDIAALNQAWGTQFASFEEVMPFLLDEVQNGKPAGGWAEHRAYMDQVFLDYCLLLRDGIRKRYPEALAGPTGVEEYPSPYGGNWNFDLMREMDTVSMYGQGRLPLSFDRNRRLIFSYRGYTAEPVSNVAGMWEGLLLGQRGLQHWWSPIFIRPDLQISKNWRYLQTLLWEFRSGVADLFYHSKKLTDSVAILYSPSSVRMNYLKKPALNQPGLYWNYATALEALGIPYRFITERELAKGELDHFQALILPEATVIGDTDATLIRQFVNRGGRVIADYDCGLVDEFYRNRSHGVLDDLFGIKQNRNGVLRFSKTPEQWKTLLEYTGNAEVDRGKTSLGELATGTAKIPLGIVNHYGKGNTLYLNFRPEFTKFRQMRQGGAWLDILRNFLALSPVATVTIEGKPVENITIAAYENTNVFYIGLLPDLPPQPVKSPEEMDTAAFPVSVKLPFNGVVYDVRAKKFIGNATKSFELNLTPGSATILAVLPGTVDGIEVNAPKSVKCGATWEAEILLTGKGAKTHHVLVVEVFDPSGNKMNHYRDLLESAEGNGTFRLTPALNDPAGTWTIVVTDGATGIATQFELTVKK